MDEENNNENEKTLKDYFKAFGKGAIKAIKAIKSVKWGLPVLCGFLLILLAAGLINLVPFLITGQYTKLFGGGSTTVDIYGNSESNLSSIVRIDPETGAFQLTDNNFSENIIKQLEEQKVSTEAFGLTGFIDNAKFKNLVDKYIKAEVMTSLPKTKMPFDLDGIIILKRKTVNPVRDIELKYVSYNEFYRMVANAKITVLDKEESEKNKDGINWVANEEAESLFGCYTIDPNTFELCIARPRGYETMYDNEGGIIGSVTIPGKGSYKSGYVEDGVDSIAIDRFEYLNYVQDFNVPLNFFISLHAIAQDAKFMNEIVDMVLGAAEKEPIVLTYIDSESEYQETNEFIGENIVSSSTKKNSEGASSDTDASDKNYSVPKTIDNENVDEYLTEEYIKENLPYFNKFGYAYTGSLHVTKANTWLKSTEKITGYLDKGPANDNKSENVYGKEGEFEHISTVQHSVGEDTTQTITTSRWLVRKTSYYADNKEYMTFDESNEIKVDELVKLIKKYPAVENRLTTAPSNLFYLLQLNENTQEFELIMRYVLYKLDDIDYGVTEADLDLIFGYSLTRGGTTYGLKEYLAQFAHGESGVPMSEDGKYYKVYKGKDGLVRVGRADLDVAAYLNIEGKILHNGEKEVENIAEYVKKANSLDLYIEKEIVDIVSDKIGEDTYTRMQEFDLSGLGLTRQQTYALIAIYEDLGGLPEIDGLSFRDVFEAGAKGCEKNSWEHNKYIWDNWWSKVGGETPQAIINRDIQFETYTKGVFDMGISEAGDVYSRKYYIYYTSAQLAGFSNPSAPQKPITRTSAEEEDIFKFENNSGTYEPVNKGIVSGYYTSTLGRKFTILNQSRIEAYGKHEDWHAKCNRAASAIVASGYSNQSPQELVDFMNTHYDATIPSTESYWSHYGLKRDVMCGSQNVNGYIKKVREQLLNGGYALVWMNKPLYMGVSGRRYTDSGLGIHWVAIIDYRIKDGQEEIVVADVNGAYWKPIDEFQFGVANLVLIGEE